jgi:hypothetical protein
MPAKLSRKRRRYVRFTRWRRRRFFALLEESGNVRLACELSGVGLGCIYRLRRTEAGFVAAMAAAKEKADARLESDDADEEGPEEDALVIRRGRGGRMRLMAAGEHWWSARHDAIFLGHLRVTGNVAASARAAGFTPKSAWNRRERMPSFARAMDEALAESQHRLEGRWRAETLRGTAGMDWEAQEEAVDAAERTPFDVDQAIRFLRYRERKEARQTRRADRDRFG